MIDVDDVSHPIPEGEPIDLPPARKNGNGHARKGGNGSPPRRTRRRSEERTELELSEMLTRRFGADLRYCASLGGWHVWPGTHWTPDELGRARECVKAIAHELAREAAALLDDGVFKAAKRAGSAGGVSAILDLARSTPGIAFKADDANRDPWLLNVRNGTIDLRTGALRRHDRNDLITSCTPIDYDPRALCPTFDRFLAEVQPDPEVRAYLARLFGYAAVGVVREHVIAVLWGPGANGKSVLAECVMRALGDHAKPGPSSLIVMNGQHEPHPTDVASCVASRLVVVHETKRGASFDASKVKLLSGGDRLTARFMRQDFFSFAPTHTLVMLSNYKPAADSSDAALWRRVQLTPFGVVVPEEKRDTRLAERICDHELPGVLRWIVDGAREWQRVGLAPPAVVREQTEAYRAGEDSVGAFLDERCARLPGVKTAAAALYQAFRTWCEGQGTKPVRTNDFAAELLGRGFERKKLATNTFYLGIGLNTDGTEEYRQ